MNGWAQSVELEIAFYMQCSHRQNRGEFASIAVFDQTEYFEVMFFAIFRFLQNILRGHETYQVFI